MWYAAAVHLKPKAARALADLDGIARKDFYMDGYHTTQLLPSLAHPYLLF